MTDHYPLMLYRAGGDLFDHRLHDEPLKIMGKFECETRIVLDAQEEAEALADGWTVSPDPSVQSAAQVVAQTVAEKDAEIELLRAQLAEAQRRKGGRPPKAEPEPEVVTEEAADGEQR